MQELGGQALYSQLCRLHCSIRNGNAIIQPQLTLYPACTCMDMDMDMDMGVCAQLYCVRLSAATHDIHTAGTPSRLQIKSLQTATAAATCGGTVYSLQLYTATLLQSAGRGYTLLHWHLQ